LAVSHEFFAIPPKMPGGAKISHIRLLDLFSVDIYIDISVKLNATEVLKWLLP